MSITVWGMTITHYPWKSAAIVPVLPLNAHTPTSLHFPSISQSEKWKKMLFRVKVLLLVDVLVPDDLVGDPVEDVEDEEC